MYILFPQRQTLVEQFPMISSQSPVDRFPAVSKQQRVSSTTDPKRYIHAYVMTTRCITWFTRASINRIPIAVQWQGNKRNHEWSTTNSTLVIFRQGTLSRRGYTVWSKYNRQGPCISLLLVIKRSLVFSHNLLCNNNAFQVYICLR